MKIWLIKHRSPAGPATAMDGELIGTAIGGASQVLPALTGVHRDQSPGGNQGHRDRRGAREPRDRRRVGSRLASIWGQYVSRSSAATSVPKSHADIVNGTATTAGQIEHRHSVRRTRCGVCANTRVSAVQARRQDPKYHRWSGTGDALVT